VKRQLGKLCATEWIYQTRIVSGKPPLHFVLNARWYELVECLPLLTFDIVGSEIN